MARPIEYEPEHVLDRALSAFWRLGYSACSFQVLIKETGMSRQGIYNTFGDKDALFDAAIAHYKSKLVQQLQPLNHPSAGVGDIRSFITASLQVQRSMGPGACFLVITAFAPKAEDPKVRVALEDGAELVRAAFERVLSHAASSRDDIGGYSPKTEAAHLYCIMNGVSALLQTGGSQTQADAVLDGAFRSLNSQ